MNARRMSRTLGGVCMACLTALLPGSAGPGIAPPRAGEHDHAFAYLLPAARTYGRDEFYLVDHLEAFVDGLAAADLEALGVAYREVVARAHGEALVNWASDGREVDPDRQAAFMLVRLFGALGDRGHAPFDDRRVAVRRTDLRPSWGRVPAELGTTCPKPGGWAGGRGQARSSSRV